MIITYHHISHSTEKKIEELLIQSFFGFFIIYYFGKNYLAWTRKNAS